MTGQMDGPRTLSLRLGALAPTIARQLADQGLEAGGDGSAEHWQRDAEAISRLHVRGLITGAAADRIRERLMKKIAKDVHPAKPEMGE